MFDEQCLILLGISLCERHANCGGLVLQCFVMTELKRLCVLKNRYDVDDVVGLEAFYIAEHPSTKTKSHLTFSIPARSSVNSLSFTLLAMTVEMIYKLSQKS